MYRTGSNSAEYRHLSSSLIEAGHEGHQHAHEAYQHHKGGDEEQGLFHDAHHGPEFLKGHGRKKVLFGTNYPMLGHPRCTGELDALGLDAEAERLFLRENAERVFGLGAA